MEGPLSDVLPRDTHDEASAKKEEGLLLHHLFPKPMVHSPRAKGFMVKASEQRYTGSTILILKLCSSFTNEKTEVTAENVFRPCRMAASSCWGSFCPRKPIPHDRKR